MHFYLRTSISCTLRLLYFIYANNLKNSIFNTFFKINWRALLVGILVQYILGVFILRLQFGYKLFQFLGNQVSTFLDYTGMSNQINI